jgi:dihydrofolate reductase
MSKLRVNCFTISLDGYGAGPDQTLENPLGAGGIALHEWMVATRTFQQMFGNEGGTTFHFVTDGIHAALDRAREAAQDHDIRIGGGVSVIRQYLKAGLIDEIHIAISPILLGSGEHLFADIDTLALGYHRTEHIPTPMATHFVLTKRG